MSLQRSDLEAYLRDEFGLDTASVTGETLLFTDGLLDSFAIGDLLVFLEEQGGFMVEPEEVVPENLDSIDRILGYCARKSGAASASA